MATNLLNTLASKRYVLYRLTSGALLLKTSIDDILGGTNSVEKFSHLCENFISLLGSAEHTPVSVQHNNTLWSVF